MQLFLSLAVALLAALCAFLFYKIGRLRWRLHVEQGKVKSSIPSREWNELFPEFRVDPNGGPAELTLAFLPAQGVLGSPTDTETWMLCLAARKAKMIFEFGTCTGRTAYLLAVNSPLDSRVVTLTLGKDELDQYRSESSDDAAAVQSALSESNVERFVYEGTDAETKITQLFGDSKAFDPGPYQAKFDMIFVDGSHAKSYVESDTQKALSMVKEGGIVFWHDFTQRKEVRGVKETLEGLSGALPLCHIAGTSLVCMRKGRPQ